LIKIRVKEVPDLWIFSLTNFIYAVAFAVAFILTLGAFTLLAWYLRWMLAVFCLFLPCMMVFWFLWVWLVVIPVGLLASGSNLDKRLVVISHWLNDANWEVLKFGFLLPYRAFILAGESAAFVATWL
jgi:hypothetical protein